MQNRFLKFLGVFLICIFISPLALHARLNTSLLLKADSLFQQKRYTQSYEIYQTLFQNHQYTPAMLLKMAYIQEGLDRISQSAYYLNLYYLSTRDEAALAKLEELADKYNLEGYRTDEIDKVFSLYDENKNLISIALGSVLIFFLILIIVQRLKYRIKPYIAWALLIMVAGVFLIHLNMGDRYTQAIIVSRNTYLMKAPSAGASVVSIVRDGHRVKVLGKKDVWLRVSWGDSEAYIKENNLLPIRL